MRWKTDKLEDRQLLVSDYGKKRLLTYADSFRELAKSFHSDFNFEGEDRQTFLEAVKLWENRQVIIDNLNEMALIMTRVASEVFRYRPMESRKHKLVVQALKTEGIYVTDLFYTEQPRGHRGIGLTMYSEASGTITSEEVADMLSVLLNQRLEASAASPYLVDNTKQNYVFIEEAEYIMLTGVAKAIKEEESISGDNYSVIEYEKGRTTILLSDGMGSGEKASIASDRVLDLMEKMLEAGYGIDTAVSLVNNALLSRGEEQNISTLDICDLNLYEGICSFMKAGAAASFLKRDSTVEQITSQNLPLGVFPVIEAEVVQRDLMDGDYLILITDGVLDALIQSNYEEAMCRMISNLQEQNPKEMADRILQFVLHCSGGRVQDDMSVIVIGVWENQ